VDYVVLDIESTGGAFNEEAVMEIALFRYNGREVTDQLISLVSPGRSVHPYVTKLTGITEKMLKRAPRFHELARRIIELTEDAILVGHNVGFDYRMLQLEYRRLGYDYHRPVMDTIELSKKMVPDLPSYGLAKVCEVLGISHPDQHRAEGDARATLDLFKILLEKDHSKEALRMASQAAEAIPTEQKLTKLLQPLKNRPGVFYLLNSQGTILYIGQADKVRQALEKLFLGTADQARALQEATEQIKVEETGSALIAELLEMEARFNLKPTYNKRWNPRYRRRNVQVPPHWAPVASFVFQGPGRHSTEKSVVVIENGQCIGYAFYQLETELENLERFKHKLVTIHHKPEANAIVTHHLGKGKKRVA
jgi:DNA polymerase-3 subunit epsilon